MTESFEELCARIVAEGVQPKPCDCEFHIITVLEEYEDLTANEEPM